MTDLTDRSLNKWYQTVKVPSRTDLEEEEEEEDVTHSEITNHA